MADLFDSDSTDFQGLPKIYAFSPLAVRMRPRNIDEVVGQNQLLQPGSPLRNLLEKDGDAGASIVLWGPPGTGKTTLAYLIASCSGRTFVEISAVSAGVKEIRSVIDQAKRQLSGFGSGVGRGTILFVDEVHRFSKSQQDVLLPAVENRWVTLVAATTENPSFSVISPLLSRSLLLQLQPLSSSDLELLIERALTDPRGLDNKFQMDRAARDGLIRVSGADARRALTLLEASAQAGLQSSGKKVITEQAVALGADSALVRYDQDQHYDVASAFIKSVRGSDVDGAIHYLARMLEAGEDPRFVARRLMICAAEDIGLADPGALMIATSAAQSVALVGMPEARIILAQATITLALAPKSNSAYLAIDRAIADIRAGKGGVVPPHLRDSHYQGASSLGHGQGYRYAHDYDFHVAKQQYLPADLESAVYYEPGHLGREEAAGQRHRRLKQILTGCPQTDEDSPTEFECDD